MHELAPLIYDLALMLGVAGIVVILFQRIKQPVVLGYIVAGIIIGPHTPPHALVNDIPNIQILSELGVIFLMFSLGLEFSFHKLTRVGFSALITGFAEVCFMIIVGYFAGRILGWSYYNCLFLGAALAISSTTIIIKAINELNLQTKRFAELIFGILIVEDLLAILLLVALSTVVTTHQLFSFDMVNAAVKLILVVGGWFIVGYFLVPPFFKRIAKYLSEETLTIISVALCLSLVCLAATFHYSTALGAFIMGSILAETALVHRIEELIRPIRDIFAAVFFISVGMLINPMVIITEWQAVIFIALITIIGKLFSTSTAAFLTGQSIKTSVRVGFSMAQVGEFSFIIAGLGVFLGVTNKQLYPIIVAVSGITTFATPYLIRVSGPLGEYLQQHLPFRHYLKSYSKHLNETKKNWQRQPEYSLLFLRFSINGLIIAIIFTLLHYFIFHRLLLFPEKAWVPNTLLLMIALLISSPFIYGMLFALQDRKIFLLNIFLWVLTITELLFLSLVYFNTWVSIIFFFCICTVFAIFFIGKIAEIYSWLELQFSSNIKMHPKRGWHESGYKIGFFVVDKQHSACGKSIKTANIVNRATCILINLEREHTNIFKPSDDIILQENDILTLVSTEKQLQTLELQSILRRINE